MPTQYYVSGPGAIWVGTGSSFAYEYLGWSESGFRIAIQGIYEDIPVDFAGGMPGDVQLMGESATASGMLKYYDESIAKKMYSFFNGKTAGSGAPFANIVGSLMVNEGGTVPILIYSPYVIKPAYNLMAPCFQFYAAYMSDTYDQTFNVKPRAPTIGFRAIPVFGALSGSVFVPGAPPLNSYQLFTNSLPPDGLPNYS